MNAVSVAVESICLRICSGGTPKSNISSYYENGRIPWLNTKEICFNRIYDTEQHITEDGIASSSARWIEPNSIVVAMYGATAAKAAIAKCKLTTNQACCNLEIDPTRADYRFVYYWFKQNYSQIAGLANGGAQQNLNVGLIKSLIIALPPLCDQTRVGIFLSLLDDKIELNNRINDYLAA